MSKFYAGNAGIGNTTNNNFAGIVVMPIGDDESNVKLAHDTYEVFVNGDKVGNKVLLTQTDDVNDLNSYLKDNGFENFEYKVIGDHIEIKADEESDNMKEILSSYLELK